MYVEKTDTYTCDFCGHNAKWDASDDVHGELWSCEAEGCGKVFCSKCFISAFGQEIYMTMMQSGENVLCPECAKKKYKKEMGRRRKPSSTMTGTEPLHTTARSIRISKRRIRNELF